LHFLSCTEIRAVRAHPLLAPLLAGRKGGGDERAMGERERGGGMLPFIFATDGRGNNPIFQVWIPWQHHALQSATLMHRATTGTSWPLDLLFCCNSFQRNSPPTPTQSHFCLLCCTGRDTPTTTAMGCSSSKEEATEEVSDRVMVHHQSCLSVVHTKGPVLYCASTLVHFEPLPAAPPRAPPPPLPHACSLFLG
jgi:hypothetical protein